MRRRDFIKGIVGSTTALPLVARAQQPSPPMIGFLRSASNAGAAHLVTGFRNGLKEAGFVEGQTLRSNIAQRMTSLIDCRASRLI